MGIHIRECVYCTTEKCDRRQNPRMPRALVGRDLVWKGMAHCRVSGLIMFDPSEPFKPPNKQHVIVSVIVIVVSVCMSRAAKTWKRKHSRPSTAKSSLSRLQATSRKLLPLTRLRLLLSSSLWARSFKRKRHRAYGHAIRVRVQRHPCSACAKS